VPDEAGATDASQLSIGQPPFAEAAPEMGRAGEAGVSEGAANQELFGTLHLHDKWICGAVRKGAHREYIADDDLRTSFVDGDDLLALVNRSPQGALPPDYAPNDLVDARSGTAKTKEECDRTQCLRKDPKEALDQLLSDWKKIGAIGKIESAYRSYSSQCGTFAKWVEKSTFCDATEQSALPGHSQHQLGTTLDLFTEEWAAGDPRGVFREGFGCTAHGKWLQDHSWEYGFVLPYPIHPDDRHPAQKCATRWDIPIGINPKTGYRYEHWHLRFIGKENARTFHEVEAASLKEGPNEITLEQWLRKKRGLTEGDAELPVCDGCNCGACSTRAKEGACKQRSVRLDERGLAKTTAAHPTIEKASLRKGKGSSRLLEVALNIPEGTLTQPPVFAGHVLPITEDYSLTPFAGTMPRSYPTLPHACQLAIGPAWSASEHSKGVRNRFPWRVALTNVAEAEVYTRANVLLPAATGTVRLRIPISLSKPSLTVAIMCGGNMIPETETAVTP